VTEFTQEEAEETLFGPREEAREDAREDCWEDPGAELPPDDPTRQLEQVEEAAEDRPLDDGATLEAGTDDGAVDEAGTDDGAALDAGADEGAVLEAGADEGAAEEVGAADDVSSDDTLLSLPPSSLERLHLYSTTALSQSV
jgi:hypothetical protein